MPSRHAPILLTNADFYGTLAAVRCLGRRGIPTVVAAERLLEPARWSRFASRVVKAPGSESPLRFMEWLVDFGRREPGHVLYPTSDETAWLFALHRDELAPYFVMSQPDVAVIESLLDKERLRALCAEVGIATPATHTPRGATEHDAERELHRLLHSGELPLGFPMLVKPRTQVLPHMHLKGMLVSDPGALIESYRAVRAATRHHALLASRIPDADQPMLQAYHHEAAKRIYSVAGFVDRDGSVTALAARKVLQRPRRLGIGLCFEALSLERPIVDGLARLARRAGYHGVFEAELIESDGHHLLIDFNPRFYGQMAFEIDRGLPLPLIAYEAALGRSDALDEARRRLAAADGARAGYVHGAKLAILTYGQRLTGHMSAGETRHWREWCRSHRGGLTDAVATRDDRAPAVADAAGIAWSCLRHPRDFLRTIVLDRVAEVRPPASSVPMHDPVDPRLTITPATPVP